MAAPAPLLHVLVQWCRDPRPERQAEYDACLAANLDNPWVVAVHNLTDPAHGLPPQFQDHPKFRAAPASGWLTYAEAFAYAAAELPGQAVALINLDIALDPASPWDEAVGLLAQGLVLCQTRHEWDGQAVWRDPALWGGVAGAHSQDGWLFLAPLHLPGCDFRLGTLGCDNALAERLRGSGRRPCNRGGRFRLLHRDQARGKSGGNAVGVHEAEGRGGPVPQGQYLLPDFEEMGSVDAVLDALGASGLDRYQVACDLISAVVKVRN